MQDVSVLGSIFYHKTLIDSNNNYAKLYQMLDSDGNAVAENFSGSVTGYKLLYDTVVIGGNERTSSYTIFSNNIETGYTVLLPPASFFPGARVKIINGTIQGGSGSQAALSPSKINIGVVYREDLEYYLDGDISYALNFVASAIPVTVLKQSSRTTFVGAPDDSSVVTHYTLPSDTWYDCHVLRGDEALSGEFNYTPVTYKQFELVAQRNPYTSRGYAWVIITAQE